MNNLWTISWLKLKVSEMPASSGKSSTTITSVAVRSSSVPLCQSSEVYVPLVTPHLWLAYPPPIRFVLVSDPSATHLLALSHYCAFPPLYHFTRAAQLFHTLSRPPWSRSVMICLLSLETVSSSKERLCFPPVHTLKHCMRRSQSAYSGRCKEPLWGE